MVKTAAYLEIFYEGKNGWEATNQRLQEKYRVKRRGFWNKFIEIVGGRKSSMQLATLCSISAIIYASRDLNTMYAYKIYFLSKDIYCFGIIILAIILWIGMYKYCKSMFSLGAKKREYVRKFKEIKNDNL